MQDKFRIDELYQFLFVRPIKKVAQAIYFVVDRILIDKILVGVPVAAVDFFGRLSRSVQGSGDGQRYMAVFALGVAGLVYPAPVRWRDKLVKLVQDKFRIDELYQFLFVRPIRKVSQAIYFVVDRILIDKILVGVPVAAVDFFGRLSRSVQGSGDGQRYMAVFALGVAGLVYLSTRPMAPDPLKVTVSGMGVDVDARRNNKTSSEALEYSYDFDDGGKPEAPVTAPTAHHNYARPGSYTIRVDVKDTHWNTSSSVKQKVTVR